MINTRLKEEREKLGLNQDDFSALAGAKRRTLVDWEKGVSSPTAVQLSKLAEAGADTQYILTGRKACYSESDIAKGISSFLFDSADLGWLTKSKDTAFSTVVDLAICSIKKAAGESTKMNTEKTDKEPLRKES